MRRYYTEYVRHCIRFYITTLDIGTVPRFNTEVDKNNWMACHSVLKNFNSKNMDIVCEVYSRGDTIPDKVYNLAKEANIEQDYIWNLLASLERDIAKKRGLL